MAPYMYDAANAPSIATCKAHGAAALSHYLTDAYEYTSFQPAATRASGLGALLNMEGLPAALVGASRAQGQAFAERALAATPPAALITAGVAVVYSVDTELSDVTACDQAFLGINDVHRSSVGKGIRVGVYGQGTLIMRLHKAGLIQVKGWLSKSSSFPGFAASLTSGTVGIVQMHNAAGTWIDTDIPGTDRSTILDPVNSGIWWPNGSRYYAPTPTIAAQEAPMDITPDLFYVDPAECARKHVPWFGWGFDFFNGSPRHIALPGEVAYRVQVQGMKPRKISIAEFKVIGGK